MSSDLFILEKGDSRSEAGMTKEPSDAETCLHVSISEANQSGPVRGMTCFSEVLWKIQVAVNAWCEFLCT